MGPTPVADPTEAIVEVHEPTIEITEIAEEKYETPQPDIARGTRIRMFPKNFRNQLCGCNSGKKFKKCCIDQVRSEDLYRVPSAETK